MTIAIAGAGFTGAVIARELAEAGKEVFVFEKRGHVAGNCWTRRDPQSGAMEHVYGPHAFHTSNERVKRYVQRWGKWEKFEVRTKAVGADGQVYSFPINMHTINQFFGKRMLPEEAKQFIARRCRTDVPLITFRDQAISMIGPELYKNFLEGYTRKQWGMDPEELPASILKRLPMRFTYDDRYFDDTFQALPVEGYTKVVQNILEHRNIYLNLNTPFGRDRVHEFSHVFWTGPIDAYFGYDAGDLAYRTLRFERYNFPQTWQGNPVINFCGEQVPYTRCTEHAYFNHTPPRAYAPTLVSYEYSSLATREDEPYYPIRLVDDKKIVNVYEARAAKEPNVTFAGRLGTYRYLDMHVAIREALDAADKYLGRTYDYEQG